MTTHVKAVFTHPSDARIAIDTLAARGIPLEDVSVMASESVGKESFGVETHSKMAEGTAVGATTGAAAGAIIGGLTAVGAIATGGVGLIAAGPIVAALAGAGAGGTGGGVLGALIGLGFKEDEVKHFENSLKANKVIVSVHCDDANERETAREVLKDADAESVH